MLRWNGGGDVIIMAGEIAWVALLLIAIGSMRCVRRACYKVRPPSPLVSAAQLRAGARTLGAALTGLCAGVLRLARGGIHAVHGLRAAALARLHVHLDRGPDALRHRCRVQVGAGLRGC